MAWERYYIESSPAPERRSPYRLNVPFAFHSRTEVSGAPLTVALKKSKHSTERDIRTPRQPLFRNDDGFHAQRNWLTAIHVWAVCGSARAERAHASASAWSGASTGKTHPFDFRTLGISSEINVCRYATSASAATSSRRACRGHRAM